MEFFLLTIGAALVLAYIGATVLKRLGIPQTLGFMLAGVILGFTRLLPYGRGADQTGTR